MAKMKGKSSYVPPPYVPLGQSDSEAEIIPRNEDHPVPSHSCDGPAQWSSGICACCDDLPSWTLIGSCMTHFTLWALVNTVCCFMTDGLLLGLPGCLVACYACGYRRALREKYNLLEAPCGDVTTHFFCHLCANCQEYREIRERSGDSDHRDFRLAEMTAPSAQTMKSDIRE